MLKFFRQATNRVLHLLARSSPGARTLRPYLHRLRGVSIGRNVWIGDDVYLENEHPELIELHENCAINIRTTIIAHTKGKGKVIIEKDAFIGCNCVITCPPGHTIVIGMGSVISANSVITRSIPACSFVVAPASKILARVTTPLVETVSYEEFLQGLKPPQKKSKHGGTKKNCHE